MALSWGVDALVSLSRVGVRGLMSQECVAGTCARQSFDESRELLAADVAFTAIYSQRDGVVDWRACIDPTAVAVEVALVAPGHGRGPARHRRGDGRAARRTPRPERAGLRIA